MENVEVKIIIQCFLVAASYQIPVGPSHHFDNGLGLSARVVNQRRNIPPLSLVFLSFFLSF